MNGNLASARRCCHIMALPFGSAIVTHSLLSTNASPELTNNSRTCSVLQFVGCSLDSQINKASHSFAIQERITKERVIACVRAESAERALDMARAALDGGLSVLEVTMTTPSAAEVINELSEEYPSALIGAGTVLSSIEAKVAKAAGAKFLMSPVALKELIQAYCHDTTLFIPGAITPNEVLNAYNWGAAFVKLYPVALMGGIALVQALKKSFHQIPLIASQGITLEMFGQYITAGASAVVLSDAIFPKSLVDAKEFNRIQQRARFIAENCCLTEKH